MPILGSFFHGTFFQRGFSELFPGLCIFSSKIFKVWVVLRRLFMNSHFQSRSFSFGGNFLPFFEKPFPLSFLPISPETQIQRLVLEFVTQK